MNLSEEFLEKLKFKNEITNVISRYVTLKKVGSTYWACCPFHHEKTPSFAINSVGQYYHCFGCGEGGSVIKFIQKIEGLDFIEAVRKLAKDSGLPLPEDESDQKFLEMRKRKDRLAAVCTDAAKFYNKKIHEPCAKHVREYLKNRGVLDSTVTKMGLGYSPDWTSLVNYLEQKGYTKQEMLDAGVVAEKNGRVYDFMFERLVFPVINHKNMVVGFSGRALGETDFAKYKNTGQTENFNKSSIIYGVHTLRKARLNTNYAILVEGQMDVVALHQAGFVNAIATMGTAFNENHVNTLKRFVDRVIVCFDGDTAGIKATSRSLEPLLKEGLEIYVISLPEKLDPDEYIKKYGAEKFQEELDKAKPVYEFELRHLITKFDLKDPANIGKYIDEAVKILVSIKDAFERDEYMKLTASLSGANYEIVKRKLEKVITNKVHEEIKQKQNAVKEENLNTSEVFILASILTKEPFAKHEDFEESSFESETLKHIFNLAKDHSTSSIIETIDEDKKWALNKLLSFDFSKIKNKEGYYLECKKAITLKKLTQELHEIKESVKNTDSQEEKQILLSKLVTLTKEINRLKADKFNA